MLPQASKAVSKVLPGLPTGALSSPGSFGMGKILGKGVQTGGSLIPQNKIPQLIANKHLLSAKKKTEYLGRSYCQFTSLIHQIKRSWRLTYPFMLPPFIGSWPEYSV